VDWLYNYWNSLEKLEYLQKYLRFAPVLGTLIGTLLLVWVGLRIDSLKSARDEAEKETLARGIEVLNPYRQPVGAVTAIVQIFVKSDQKVVGRVIHPGAFLAFVIGGKQLIEGSSLEYIAIPVVGGIVRYTSDLPLDVRKSARGIPVSSLQDTESIKFTFYGMPDDSEVLFGGLFCTINGSIRLVFPIPTQVAQGKEIVIPDMHKVLQALKP
jgi:hypothetical protein